MLGSSNNVYPGFSNGRVLITSPRARYSFIFAFSKRMRSRGFLYVGQRLARQSGSSKPPFSAFAPTLLVDRSGAEEVRKRAAYMKTGRRHQSASLVCETGSSATRRCYPAVPRGDEILENANVLRLPAFGPFGHA